MYKLVFWHHGEWRNLATDRTCTAAYDLRTRLKASHPRFAIAVSPQ